MTTIFILCDALRYDRVTPQIMPNLTHISLKGQRWLNFFANGGATKWSLPHILCGKQAYDTVDNFPTKLTQHGINNTIIHSNAVLVSEKYQECFMHHTDVGVEMQPLKSTIRNILRKTELWKITRSLRKRFTKSVDIPYRRAENILTIAQAMIDKQGEGFYWIHLMDPHIPYSPPKLSPEQQTLANELYEKVLQNINYKYTPTPEETLQLIKLYDMECTYMDQEINKFIQHNKDALYIITSDHGEMFGENYSYSHGPYNHGMTLQLGHTPFIIYGPQIDPKTHIDYQSSIDIGATILDLYDVDPRQGYGRSMKEKIINEDR